MRLLNMTRAQWDAACVVRECPWSDYIWRGPVVVGNTSGKYRVLTPDGVDRAACGDTPAEAIENVSEFYISKAEGR